MHSKKITLLFLFIGLLFTGCSNDEDDIIQPLGDYENGILISHEGNFGQGNASVSFVSYDFETVENNIFSSVNSGPLGDTAQSMAFVGDYAYIVLNVSNTIEVVNRYTFESVATIDTGLNNPRHIAFANGKGYVTNWGDGSVATDDYLAVIDLSTNTINAHTIAVEEGPEKIIAADNTVYVAHQGGYSQNNIISIVNANTDVVASTVTVGDVPNSLQLDAEGNLWVLSSGKAAWTGTETVGKLAKIDTQTNNVTAFDFAVNEHPSSLLLENQTIYYYMAGSVFKMNTDETALPTTAEISNLSFYGMSVNNSVLYGVDAADYTSNGALIAYDLTTNTQLNSTTLSIIPSAVYFN